MDAGFYKFSMTDGLQYAPNFIAGPGFDITSETHSKFTYPVNGWYWFDTLTDAKTLLAGKLNNNLPVATTTVSGNGASATISSTIKVKDLLEMDKEAVEAIMDFLSNQISRIITVIPLDKIPPLTVSFTLSKG